MCINLTVSAASLNFFSGLVFAILVLSAVGTNTNVNVREN